MVFSIHEKIIHWSNGLDDALKALGCVRNSMKKGGVELGPELGPEIVQKGTRIPASSIARKIWFAKSLSSWVYLDS